MDQHGPTPTFSRISRQRPYVGLETGIITLVALMVRLVHLDHTPKTDELYHLLAVRSLLADGTLQLLDGPEYTRGWLFTYMTAGMVRMFGESLVVGRIIPLVAGTLLVTALFHWVRRETDRLSAWSAALLLALAPLAIDLSQYTRFYTLQALFFLGAAIVVFRMLHVQPARLGILGGLGLTVASLLGLAVHFQITTLIGIGAIAVACGVLLLPTIIRVARAHPREAVWLGGLIAGVSLLVGFLLHAQEVTSWAWAQFQHADLWGESGRGTIQYYHWLLVNQYPTFWTLFPFAILAGVTVNARFTIYCSLIFFSVFAVHSLAAWKSERFYFYAFPMFFAVSGVGVAVVLRWCHSRLREVVGKTMGSCLAEGSAGRFAVLGLMAIAILFMVHGNAAFVYTRHMLMVSDEDWVLPMRLRGEPDWPATADYLRPSLDSVDVVLASSDSEPLYFLGRLDYLVRPVLAGGEILGDFEIAPRSGLPVVSSPEGLSEVMDRYPRGMVVIEEKRWRTGHAITPELAETLEELTAPMPIDPRWRMRVLRWPLVPETGPPPIPDAGRHP